MKNKFIIGVLFGILLFLSPGVKAANFTDNQTVGANKIWTIKFTDEVKFDDLTRQGITVTDSSGNKVNTNIQLGQDDKTVTVTAPQGGYAAGKSYILNIKNGVHSSKGKALKNEYKLHFNVKNDNTVVIFKDPNLEKAIRDKINKPTGTLYKSDVENITELDLQHKKVINDLTGIENLSNLQTLKITDNKVSDITHLASLINLVFLDLDANQISNAESLKYLTNLKTLYLNGNPISDISPLSSMNNLRYLYLSGNQISDITPLKSLIGLEVLGLSANPLKDISALSNLVNLQKLYLTGYITQEGTPIGQINDISALQGLINLQYLDLKNNQISDINLLKGLTNLRILELWGNPISDSDKQSLKNALPNCDIRY